MTCSNCAAPMTNMKLGGNMSNDVEIDVCPGCQAFWFDKHESLKLSAGSTLKLMKFIGENPSGSKTFSEALRCPRCSDTLRPTKDLQRSTRFQYWRCPADHGRFIRFIEFLREKNFLRQLSQKEIAELRANIQIVNCSNCGAPIDLAATSACAHCGSPVSMLDMKQPKRLLQELQNAATPRPIDPALPLELLKAKLEVERAFVGLDDAPDWRFDSSASDLVQAGLSAVARWLNKSGL